MGSSRMVVAVAKKGGVEILINESSYRETPALVGFGQQRLVGHKAKSAIKKNFKNTIRYPMRFLTPRVNQFGLEREFSFSKARINERNAYKEMKFTVKYNGEQSNFNSRQVAAGLFNKIKDTLEYNKSDVKDLVVSVPSYFTHIERQAVLEAGKIAGLNIQRLYNESTANVMNYGIFRKKDLSDENARIVGFVDMGLSKTSVFFAKIWKNKAEILFEKNLPNVGTRNFDLNLLNLYLDVFEKENNIDDHRDSPKVRIRLLDAIEKQRKVLSANSEASANVECLFDDCDFFYNMKREEFEELSKPLIEKIQNLMLQSMTDSKISVKSLHSVEIIGGGSRIPLIQSMIEDIMGKPASKTLDASESISRGCAIKAAMVSPLFKVLDYDITDRSHYAVKIGIKYKDDTQETVKTVFREGASFDNVVSMTINKDEEVDVRLFYEDKYDDNNLVLISSTTLPRCMSKSKDFKCKLYFELNHNGLANILKFEVTEKHIVEVKEEPKKEETKIEEETDKEESEKKPEKIEVEEPKEPPKTKEVYKTRKIKFSQKLYLVSSPEEFTEMLKIENEIKDQKQNIILTQKVKYDLESFIYETRSAAQDNENVIYMNPGERENIEKECMNKEDWLYNDGREAHKDQYLKAREELNSLACGLYGRKLKHTKIEGFVENAKKGYSEFYDKYQTGIALLENKKLKKIETNYNYGLEMIGEMFVVRNNISPQALDNYDYDTKSKEINRMFQEMLDLIHAAKKKEARRLKKIEEEERKKKREAEKKEAEKIEEEKKKKEAEKIQEENKEEPNKEDLGEGEKIREEGKEESNQIETEK